VKLLLPCFSFQWIFKFGFSDP